MNYKEQWRAIINYELWIMNYEEQWRAIMNYKLWIMKSGEGWRAMKSNYELGIRKVVGRDEGRKGNTGEGELNCYNGNILIILMIWI